MGERAEHQHWVKHRRALGQTPAGGHSAPIEGPRLGLVARLVALDLHAGTRFVHELRRLWDRGDAALPIDQRLPQAAKTDLMAAMGADAVIDLGGETPLSTGLGCEPGDGLVMCTSGSTGAAKGVILTHDALAASAEASSHRLEIRQSDHWLACLPVAHVGGMSVIIRALHMGNKLTVLPGFDTAAVLDAARGGATHTSLVPTALARIDPSVFTRILLGGSQPPSDLPPNVVTTYGLTETGSGVVYDGTALPGVEIRLSSAGEVLIRGAMLLRSYRDGSSPVDTDGWLHTNDLGFWDDGRLRIRGRRDDLIITGGENVWPDVVEAALIKHPQVLDAGVAGVTDDEWGQCVCAWVVPATSAEPPTLESLRSFVKASLPAFMAPRVVRYCDHLERSALGKLQRAKLAL